MENQKNIFITRLSAGIFGGTIFGLVGFFKMMSFGAKNGQCWPPIDFIFRSRGYESCGNFGALAGLIVGSIIAVIFISKTNFRNGLKTSTLLIVSAMFLPLVYNVIKFFPKSVQDGDILIILVITLIFLLLSSLPSIVTVLLADWFGQGKK